MEAVWKVKDYKSLYHLYCKELIFSTTKEKDVRRHNVAMKKLGEIYRELKASSKEEHTFLLELLNEDDFQIKLTVAAHCLGLGVYVSRAKKTLRKIAHNKENSHVAFEAKSILEVWKKEGLEF